MILIIGGVGAGKRRFVMERLGASSEDMATARLDDCPIVLDAHRLVGQIEPDRLLPALLGKRVVVCDEVGCGVVPEDPRERRWREEAGRLCCALAEEAEVVVRLCCGLPTTIKGEL